MAVVRERDRREHDDAGGGVPCVYANNAAADDHASAAADGDANGDRGHDAKFCGDKGRSSVTSPLLSLLKMRLSSPFDSIQVGK
jgi:hypothetical protein